MLFDYYLMHRVDKDVVREAMNNLLSRSDEAWVFGRLSLGVKVQVGIAKRLNKSVRYFDISDLPVAALADSEDTGPEQHPDQPPPLQGPRDQAGGLPSSLYTCI